MSKALEALERYRYLPTKIDYDIIENALKDYERRLALAKEYKDVNNVAKRLKALEIIKKKKIDALAIIDSKDYEDYLESYWQPHELKTLTQEEYNLLKEVLL